jgi:hypothetical protein
MKKFSLIAFCLLASSFLLLQKSNAKIDISTSITFCQFEIPKEIKNSNTNFYLTYTFELTNDRKPINIKKLKDDYVGKETVANCFSGWEFTGFPKKTPIIVSFRWEHGYGWKTLSISGNNITQTINLPESKCPKC